MKSESSLEKSERRAGEESEKIAHTYCTRVDITLFSGIITSVVAKRAHPNDDDDDGVHV